MRTQPDEDEGIIGKTTGDDDGTLGMTVGDDGGTLGRESLETRWARGLRRAAVLARPSASLATNAPRIRAATHMLATVTGQFESALQSQRVASKVFGIICEQLEKQAPDPEFGSQHRLNAQGLRSCSAPPSSLPESPRH